MSRLMFVYLSGPEKGKTRIFTQNHVTVGTSDACDLKLVPEEGGAFPAGVLADVYDDDGLFHLTPGTELDGFEITVNGEELPAGESVAGYELRDGDTIHFGHGLSSASVLFQVMPENFSTGQIVRRANPELSQPPGQPVHPLTATLFVKELTASLWAEIPRKAKMGALTAVGIVVIAALGIVYFNFLMLHRNTRMIDHLSKQVESQQAQSEQDKELIKNQQEEIARLQKGIQETRVYTQRIAELYSPGVCLIVGSYSFVERGTGRVLRYEASDKANDIPVDQNGNLLASVDGAGPPVQIDYTGTGFAVREGVIATNKHVAQPWASDPVAQIIMQQGGGFRPRLDTFVAFFPGIEQPFELRDPSLSSRYDLALCSFDTGGKKIQVLPLSTDDTRSVIGSSVVLLGYPTGVDGLLQRIDENERREILRQHGDSALDVAQGLAARQLIRPLTTTGTVSDAMPGRVVHSAPTTEGGSGSPMFDREGQVIAVNSAILTTVDGNQSFSGSNFGVPVKALLEMLLAYQINEKR
ncbi:MAG TPA: trypsin-like peptidase domain-containing protein [Blastocatellia bacterium]|nr:trypsin-like peptidase domain-containing protein [Blastocatellia bacterium]